MLILGLAACGGTPDRAAIINVLQRYALAADRGDTATMCRLLTPYARRTAIRRAVSLVNHPGKVIVPAKPLIGKHGTVSCQEALRPFTGPPGPGMLTRDPAAFDALKRAQVRTAGNKAQITGADLPTFSAHTYFFAEVGGRWLLDRAPG
jgi:hypothetical protein